MLLSRTEYAAHRGITRQAVEYAIKKGVIELENGRIDVERADKAWAEGMRVRTRAVNSTREARPVQSPTPRKPRAKPAPRAESTEDDLSDLLGVNPEPTPSPKPAAASPPPPAPPTDPNGYNASRAVRERASADIITLRAAQMAGTLIEVEAVAKTWASIASDVRTAMLQIPARLAPLLAQRDQHTVRTTLDTEIRAALERLATA